MRRRRVSDYFSKYPVLFKVKDVDGILWNVREVREGKHGFDLLLGTTASQFPQPGYRSIIATPELIAFWEKHRLDLGGINSDLPASPAALAHVRARYGFRFRRDMKRFWSDHAEELKSLTTREFAERYHREVPEVCAARLRLFGRSRRAEFWWHAPETLALLASGLRSKEISEKLGITRTQARHLIRQARRRVSVPWPEADPRGNQLLPVPIQIADVDGKVWDVQETRATKHGFELHFGMPAAGQRALQIPGPYLIATHSLIEFWRAHDGEQGGSALDLPAPKPQINCLRRRFGFHFRRTHRGAATWWHAPENLEILRAGLTTVEAGRKLGISYGYAHRLMQRAKLLPLAPASQPAVETLLPDEAA